MLVVVQRPVSFFIFAVDFLSFPHRENPIRRSLSLKPGSANPLQMNPLRLSPTVFRFCKKSPPQTTAIFSCWHPHLITFLLLSSRRLHGMPQVPFFLFYASFFPNFFRESSQFLLFITTSSDVECFFPFSTSGLHFTIGQHLLMPGENLPPPAF